MSAEKEHINVVVLKGENGTVHVRTPDNLERGYVEDQFRQVTEGLGSLALVEDDSTEQAVETKTDAECREIGKMNRRTDGRPERPTKLHK